MVLLWVLVTVGLGSMPPRSALVGLPTVEEGALPRPQQTGTVPDTGSSSPPEGAVASATLATTLRVTPSGDQLTGSGPPVIPWSASGTGAVANLLPQAASDLPPTLPGVYVGDGRPPVPQKLADRILRWEFIDMGELLPEFWSLAKEEESSGRRPITSRRARKVTDIFTWVQCFGSYVSVLGPHFPKVIPELMAYMATIVRVSQDYTGLAWVRYDAAYRRQAALTGNRGWSRINSTMYTMCFTGNARTTERCELCFGSTHASKDCALRGDPDPELRVRVKAVEAAVVAMSPRQVKQGELGQYQPSGQICRLWNKNSCTFRRCRHAHICSNCRGSHSVLSCPTAGQPGNHEASVLANRRFRGTASPY